MILVIACEFLHELADVIGGVVRVVPVEQFGPELTDDGGCLHLLGEARAWRQAFLANDF